jgi:hypothetical protein
MNERIRELHMQAQQEAFNEPIDIENCAVEDIKGFSQQVYEKFAELIVQECLKKVEEEYKPVLEDKEMMKDTHWDGYVQCGVDSYVAIREHFFGVEE